MLSHKSVLIVAVAAIVAASSVPSAPLNGGDDAGPVDSVSKFKFDILGGGESPLSGRWLSVRGGGVNLVVVTYTAGDDHHYQRHPGEVYYSEITLKGPLSPSREHVNDWIGEHRHGSKGPRYVRLSFLDDEGFPVLEVNTSLDKPEGQVHHHDGDEPAGEGAYPEDKGKTPERTGFVTRAPIDMTLYEYDGIEGAQFEVTVDGRVVYLAPLYEAGPIFELKDVAREPPQDIGGRHNFAGLNAGRVVIGREPADNSWLEWFQSSSKTEDIRVPIQKYSDDSGKEVYTTEFFESWPVRHDVINVDSRSGSSTVKEVVELEIERPDHEVGYSMSYHSVLDAGWHTDTKARCESGLVPLGPSVVSCDVHTVQEGVENEGGVPEESRSTQNATFASVVKTSFGSDGSLDEIGAAFHVLFNPKEYTVEKMAPWKEHHVEGLDNVTLEFAGGEPVALRADLDFNHSEKTVVKRRGEPAEVSIAKHAPPELQCVWGAGRTFKCVVERLSVKYELFVPDGVPIRATTSVKLKVFAPQGERNPWNNQRTRSHGGPHAESVLMWETVRRTEVTATPDEDDPQRMLVELRSETSFSLSWRGLGSAFGARAKSKVVGEATLDEGSSGLPVTIHELTKIDVKPHVRAAHELVRATATATVEADGVRRLLGVSYP